VLFTLRGWGRDPFVEALRRTRSRTLGIDFDSSDEPRGADPGTVARERYERPAGALPAQRPVARRVGRIADFVAPPADCGIEREDLVRAMEDAAARALAMLASTAPSGLRLRPVADVARIAVRSIEDPVALARLADRAGVSPIDLERHALAWRVGGAEGLEASWDEWQPESRLLEPGRAVLGGTARTVANTVIGSGIQLRLGRDGRWWRFRADDRLGWVLDSEGFSDPDDLVEPVVQAGDGAETRRANTTSMPARPI
jgi:hypothetical protein